jgi:hypothetical protein
MTAPARLGENAPAWLALTAPGYRSARIAEKHYEPDPAKEAAAAARNAARHAEAVARQEAVRAARAEATAARRAETERLREERSRRLQAERRRPPLTSEEHGARIKAGLERARAEGRLPPLKVKRKPTLEEIAATRRASLAKARAAQAAKRAVKHLKPCRPRRNPASSGGLITLAEAARQVGCTGAALSNAVHYGALACERRGMYVYVQLDEVRAYRAGAADRKRAAGLANLAKAAAARKAKPARPYARLVKRGAA